VLAAAQTLDPDLPEVEAVIAVAIDPMQRHRGNRVFGAARARSLREQPQTGERGPHAEILGLAELVAQVAYNASDPHDPFHENRGWYIAPWAVGLAFDNDDDEYRARIRAAIGDWPQELIAAEDHSRT
jgi:hypothetical protein